MKSESSIEVLEFSLIIPKIIQLKQNDFNFGIGITRDKFTGKRERKNSGESVKLFSESKFGVFYAISISREKIISLPLKLELLFKHKGLKGGIFATDIEQPFVGSMDIKELQFNISYVF